MQEDSESKHLEAYKKILTVSALLLISLSVLLLFFCLVRWCAATTGWYSKETNTFNTGSFVPFGWWWDCDITYLEVFKYDSHDLGMVQETPYLL